MDGISQLQEMIDRAKRIVFFGGAGVSTASGIPDFTGKDGLYRQKYGELTPEMMLSQSFFYLHPDRFYAFYREHMLHPQAQPNAAHRKLYALERAGKLAGLITHNIDGLHRQAGNRYVYVLRGDKVSLNKVELGTRTDSGYEIISGVADGDTVVVAGQSRLADGVRVQLNTKKK